MFLLIVSLSQAILGAKKIPGEGILKDILGHILVFVLFVVVAAVVSIGKLIVDKLKPRKKTVHEKTSKDIRKEDIERLERYGLTVDTVCKSTWTLYTVVQNEISKNNLEEVKDYLSPSLYTEYKSKIDELSKLNQLHITDLLTYKDDTIAGFKEDGDDLCVLMLFRYICRDYVINTVDNSVVKNSKRATYECMYWIEVRVSKNNSEGTTSMILENVKMKEQVLL
jgi:hypothetical protein